MSGISPGTAQLAAKKALLAAVRHALAGEDVDICFGFRWPFRADDWVAAVDTFSDIDAATIGPRRQLDERITLSLAIGSWRSVTDIDGGEDAEVAAAERAFDLLDRIQQHVRLVDPTLGGAVLWCIPGSSSSDGATSEEEASEGRWCEIAATFVCSHRIR